MMFNIRAVFSTVLLTTLLAGVSPGQEKRNPASLADFDWLIGTWKRETSRGILYEEWTKVSENTLEGESYRLIDGTKSFAEFLRLEQFGDKIFYTAVVPHNAFPTPFKLIQSSDRKAVFENPGHDFPQRIIYAGKETESLHARIEGKNNGKESAVDFFFVKVK